MFSIEAGHVQALDSPFLMTHHGSFMFPAVPCCAGSYIRQLYALYSIFIIPFKDQFWHPILTILQSLHLQKINNTGMYLVKKQQSLEQITFKTAPQKISAVQAYMGGMIKQPLWDLCTPCGRYALWGLRQQLLRGNVISIMAVDACFRNNDEMAIVGELGGVRFASLSKLSLQGNNIQSVEDLANINAPFLTSLILNRNCIVEVKSLRKAIFPVLETLELKDNKIMELSCFSELDLPRLEDLVLQSALESQPQAHNVTPVHKTPFNLKWLFIVSRNRISQSHDPLHRHWPDCEVRAKVGRRRAYNIVRSLAVW